MGRPKIEIEQETLERLYIHEKRSPKEIALQFASHRQTIINRLRDYGLAVRTKSEGTAIAKTTHHRADFSGDLIEKAYLIGLRTGDLSVDMTNPGGQTIRVSCASTRPEQIELIKNLFSSYGHTILNGPYTNGRGTQINKDIWRLGIYSGNHPKRLIQHLQPYLRHAKRKQDAQKVMNFLLEQK